MCAALSIPPPLRERSARDKSLPFSASHTITGITATTAGARTVTTTTAASVQDLTSTVSRSYSPMTSQRASQPVAIDCIEDEERSRSNSGSTSYLAAPSHSYSHHNTNNNNIIIDANVHRHTRAAALRDTAAQNTRCPASNAQPSLYRVGSVAGQAPRARSASPRWPQSRAGHEYDTIHRRKGSSRLARAHSASARATSHHASTTTSSPPVKIVRSAEQMYRMDGQRDTSSHALRQPRFVPLPRPSSSYALPERHTAPRKGQQQGGSGSSEADMVQPHGSSLDSSGSEIAQESSCDEDDDGDDDATPAEMQASLQRTRIRALVHEKAQLARALAELRDLFEHLTQDYDKVTSEAASKGQYAEALQAQVRTLREELRLCNATCATQEAQIAKFSETWCERSAGLQGQLQVLSQERKELLQQRDELLAGQHTLRKEAEALQAALQREKEEQELRRRRERRAMEEEMEKVYAEKERLLGVREAELRRSAATLAETMHHVASENDQGRELLQAMRRKAASLKLQLQRQTEAQAQAERTVSELRAELAQAATETRARREASERRARELQQSHDAERHELRRLQREAAAENAFLQQRMHDMAAEQQAALGQERRHGQAAVQREQQRAEELRGELQRVSDELERRRAQAELAERRVRELSEVQSQLEQRLVFVQGQRSELEAVVKEKERTGRQLRQKVDHLLRRLAAQDEALEHYRRVVGHDRLAMDESEVGVRYVTWHSPQRKAPREEEEEVEVGRSSKQEAAHDAVHTPANKTVTTSTNTTTTTAIDGSPSAHVASAQEADAADGHRQHQEAAAPAPHSQPGIETIDRSLEREASMRHSVRHTRLSTSTSVPRYSLRPSLSQARQRSTRTATLPRGTTQHGTRQTSRHQYNIVSHAHGAHEHGTRDGQDRCNGAAKGHWYNAEASDMATTQQEGKREEEDDEKGDAQEVRQDESVYFDELPARSWSAQSRSRHLYALRASAADVPAYATRPSPVLQAKPTVRATMTHTQCRADAPPDKEKTRETASIQDTPPGLPHAHHKTKTANWCTYNASHAAQARPTSSSTSSLFAATASSSTYEIHQTNATMPLTTRSQTADEVQRDDMNNNSNSNQSTSQKVASVVQQVMRTLEQNYETSRARHERP